MQKQTTRQIKTASCGLLALAAFTLAGCGNHDQAGNGTKTPDQVRQESIQHNEDFANHPPPSAAPPAAKPSTGP